MARTTSKENMWNFKSAAVIVAHPDDETLWAGGTILLNPDVEWNVVTLCRKSDIQRSENFRKALESLGARGKMGDMDDGPEQSPLQIRDIQDTVMGLLEQDRFDLVITHGLWGEYSTHKRHEELGKAVLGLRELERLFCKQLWMFAYEDGGGRYLPRPEANADITTRIPEYIWEKKYHIITDIYGFSEESFEAKTAPKQEAFWLFE